MKAFIFLASLACASAGVLQYAYPTYAYNAWPAYSANQYHAQDEFGQASFGYSHPGQAASNYRDAFGNQVGSYSYINPEGKQIIVQYIADSNGYRVLSNALPEAPVYDGVAPVDTGVAPIDTGVAPIDTGVAPEPVQDTAEVAEAKAEFFRLYKQAAEAAKAAPESRKKRGLLYATPFALPAFARSTIETSYLEQNPKAKTPAATTKLELKTKQQDILTHLAFPYQLGYPFAYPFLTKIQS